MEVVNRTLGAMLRSMVKGKMTSWEEHLPLIEFAYNNSYYARIGMAPFEPFYGRRYRSPIG